MILRGMRDFVVDGGILHRGYTSATSNMRVCLPSLSGKAVRRRWNCLSEDQLDICDR